MRQAERGTGNLDAAAERRPSEPRGDGGMRCPGSPAATCPPLPPRPRPQAAGAAWRAGSAPAQQGDPASRGRCGRAPPRSLLRACRRGAAINRPPGWRAPAPALAWAERGKPGPRAPPLRRACACPPSAPAVSGCRGQSQGGVRGRPVPASVPRRRTARRLLPAAPGLGGGLCSPLGQGRASGSRLTLAQGPGGLPCRPCRRLPPSLSPSRRNILRRGRRRGRAGRARSGPGWRRRTAPLAPGPARRSLRDSGGPGLNPPLSPLLLPLRWSAGP